jgi:hypothetical protein
VGGRRVAGERKGRMKHCASVSGPGVWGLGDGQKVVHARTCWARRAGPLTPQARSSAARGDAVKRRSNPAVKPGQRPRAHLMSRWKILREWRCCSVVSSGRMTSAATYFSSRVPPERISFLNRSPCRGVGGGRFEGSLFGGSFRGGVSGWAGRAVGACGPCRAAAKRGVVRAGPSQSMC